MLTIYRVDTRCEKLHTRGALRSDALNGVEYLTLLVEKHAETLTLPVPQYGHPGFHLPQNLPKLSLLSVAFCEMGKIEGFPGDYNLPDVRELCLNPAWGAMYDADDEDLSK